MCNPRRLSLLVVGFLLTASAGFAQIDRGTITGIVTDQSGAVIPGVAITVTNAANGVSNHVVSNAAGAYSVQQLQAGVYRLVAEKDGFKKFSQTNIVVQVGGTTPLDVALTLGSKTETVTVTAEAPLLERDTSDTGTTVTSREVDDLPLVAENDQRSPAYFMQLAPGVTGRGNNTGAIGTGRVYGTQTSGAMVGSTTMMLDGADVPSDAPSTYEGDLRSFQMPPDAISEFKLEATNGSAEYGRSGGGTASFEVKSGGNQIHGTAYEYLRNNVLDARNFFSPTVSPEKQNDFGVTAGGPIKKNKAFIFGYYDGYRLVSSPSSALALVPTAQMKEGDFTQLDQFPTVYDQVLYDPSTSTTCGPIICGNKIIDQTALSAISQKILPSFPAANAHQGTPQAIFYNYINTVENPLSVNMYGFKGDYNINERNRLSVLYDTGKNSTPNIGEIPAPLGGGDQPSTIQTRNARVNWNLMLKPNVNNVAVASFNSWNNGTPPVSSYGGRSDWVDYLGLKGFDPNLKTEFPQIVIDMPGEFADSYNGGGGEGVDDNHSEEVKDTLTWIRGKHTLKFGLDYQQGADNSISPGRNAGYFQFTNTETGIPSVTNSGSGFASFLLGYASTVNDEVYTAPAYSRNGYLGAFVQDDWKLTRKLTVNVGLRWDMFIPDYHRYNQKSWIGLGDPNPGAPGEIGVLDFANNYPLRSGVYTHHHDFAPRLGFAYSLNDKTVIRAAFGIYFAQGNADRVSGGNYVQGYNLTPAIGSTSQYTPAEQWDGNCPAFAPGCLNAFPTTGSGFVTSLTPTAENGGSAYSLDKTDGTPPYAENFQISVQRQLPGQITLTAAYIGNTGVHIPSFMSPTTEMPPQYLALGSQCYSPAGSPAPCSVSTSIPLLFEPLTFGPAQTVLAGLNQPVDPATGNHSPFPGFQALYANASTNLQLGKALSIYPQYNGLTRGYEGIGVSTYNALQIKAEKRFSNGLTMLLSYAWSKNLTDGGSMFSVFSSQFGAVDSWNNHDSKSYGFNDMPQLASFSYVYDLPVGLGRHFLNHPGVANQIIGGWKISGIQQYQSGQPESVEDPRTDESLEEVGSGGYNTPDTIPGVPQKTVAKATGHFDPAVDFEFNEAAFKYPCTFCFGTQTSTEGTVRAFGYFDEDFSLLKDWRIHESWVLNFHVDVINAFNRVQFVQYQGQGGYDAEPSLNGPGASGFSTLSDQPNPPRQFQLGMRLKW